MAQILRKETTIGGIFLFHKILGSMIKSLVLAHPSSRQMVLGSANTLLSMFEVNAHPCLFFSEEVIQSSTLYQALWFFLGS